MNANDKEILFKAIEIGIKFKNQINVKNKGIDNKVINRVIHLEEDPNTIESVISILENEIIPRCTNFSSPNFMGFPDSGNSLYALFGAILSDLLQQNLINSTFCAPVATLIEIEVLQYIRKKIGYPVKKIENIYDVGGIITTGGTASNAIAMLLAREHHKNNTMKVGVINPKNYKIIVPEGIGHYSIKSSQMWIGCGNNILEVKTNNYRYDLKALKEEIEKNKGNIMAVVVYAGDSRTMTIDYLEKIYELIKNIDEDIWLHADACNGFCLAFHEELKKKIKGIELFDSITSDPHKMLEIPYTVSALFVKEQEKLESILTESDLIMKENLAFGKITPFIGSKSWMSLKLWLYIKTLGGKAISDRMMKRYNLAQKLKNKLEESDNFVVLNDVDAFSVVFMYCKNKKETIERINKINKMIHKQLLEEGKFYLHSFPIKDNKKILSDNKIIYPLRFFSGNHLLTEKNLNDIIGYIENLGNKIEKSKGKE